MTRQWKTQETSPAYERPAVMPEDPAVVAGADYERAFVQTKRRRGVSWANIARMLGKAEGQLRRSYGGGGL